MERLNSGPQEEKQFYSPKVPNDQGNKGNREISIALSKGQRRAGLKWLRLAGADAINCGVRIPMRKLSKTLSFWYLLGQMPKQTFSKSR